ncbi:MAG TPA: lipopolysaccharide biosynthesis protein [Thermoanaerobaculia bacterium]|nr:lipopolysaccharide biosynthesis protein [Thermoanaerobaculia bacterium]
MTLGRLTARAAVWAFVSTAGTKIITLVGLALLARILAPREFGLLAFAMTYIAAAEAIGDLGSGVALVYWPDRRDDASQVTFLINAIGGLFWCGLTLILAPFVANFFQSPAGTPIVRLLAVSFILKFLGNTHDALAQKDLAFRKRLIPDLGLALFKAGVAIVLAYQGFGAYSLAWGHIAGTGARTLLLWIAIPWRPKFRVPWDLVKPMLRYGRGIISVNALGVIGHHADMAIVGRFLGVTALGLYQMASKVPEATIIVVLWVTSKILFPAFAKLQASGASMHRPYILATKYVAAVTMPAATGLAVLATPAILVAFGPAWRPAAPILAALAINAALRGIGTQGGDLLKAAGHAQLHARIALFKMIPGVPLMLLGATTGNAVWVAAALATASAVASTIDLTVTSRVMKIPLRDTLAACVPSFIASIAMGAALFAWLRWAAHATPVMQLFGGVMLGAIVYAAVLAFVDRDFFRRARAHFFSGLPFAPVANGTTEEL